MREVLLLTLFRQFVVFSTPPQRHALLAPASEQHREYLVSEVAVSAANTLRM